MSNRAAAGDEVPDEHNHGDDEQKMDEASRYMEGEEAERPQDKDDDGDGQEHERSSLGVGRVTVGAKARSAGG
jgi:hypothetical protein